MGARVVQVESKGYGNALMGGIAAARGKFIIMGDADDSYDFLEIPRFVEKLRAGYSTWSRDAVCRREGAKCCPERCRFCIAGGAIRCSRGWLGGCSTRRFMMSIVGCAASRKSFMTARSTLHRYGIRHRDDHQGQPLWREDHRSSDNAASRRAKAHAPHLKTFRDGWRTFRFFLMYSPRWLFLIPGLLLFLLGLIGYGLAMPGLMVMGVTFDAHTLLFASLAILCGYQSILFAIFSKTFAISRRAYA